MSIIYLPFMPLLGVILTLFYSGEKRLYTLLLSCSGPLLALVSLGWHFSQMDGMQPLVVSVPWVPIIHLFFSVRLDGLSFLFALLILVMGLLILFYACYYLSHRDSLKRLNLLLLLFMSAMCGIVLSENLVVMVVFWELTSLASFLLIGYWSDRSAARKGARMAAITTCFGGLLLLVAVLWIGELVGSLEFSEVLRLQAKIHASDQGDLVLLLLILAAATKSAQFPFHFWLPNAMVAPTPVSAYLHSATMVKAGLFLIARFYPIFSHSELWFLCITGMGLITLLYGAVNAFFKHDLKALLAYSTISHLGLIMMLLGFATPFAAMAALFHLINHAVFKASLFMAAGIIEHETGTRDIRQLGGLYRVMPYTALLATVAAASMAGVPLFNGFLSKEMFFTESLAMVQGSQLNPVVPILAFLAFVFSVGYSVRFVHDVYFSRRRFQTSEHTPSEPDRRMRLPIELLAGGCLLIGLFPQSLIAPLIITASTPLVGQLAADQLQISLWHGLTPALFTSFFALLFGVLLYQRRHAAHAVWDNRINLDAMHLFERAQHGLFEACRISLTLVYPRKLGFHLSLILGAFLLAALWPMLTYRQLPLASLTEFDLEMSVLALALIIASIATIKLHQNRFAALLVMGVVGLAQVLIFLHYSAPDLALTQLSVEVVTVILLMLILYFLPQTTADKPNKMQRNWHLGMALATGAVMGVLTLYQTSEDRPLSRFFLDKALPEGGGHNVVNVILVDFRGFDTLGEITVLAIAAVAIHNMLSGLRLPMPRSDAEGRRWSKDKHPLILTTMSNMLFPLALLVSVYLFLRGHHSPGGGFTAGLVAGIALILQYVASGEQWVRERMQIHFPQLLGTGVLVATVTGFASWVFGHPFLSSTVIHFPLPFLGTVELASAAIFDLGVYLTVVGSTLLILAYVGRLTATSKGHELE